MQAYQLQNLIGGVRSISTANVFANISIAYDTGDSNSNKAVVGSSIVHKLMRTMLLALKFTRWPQAATIVLGATSANRENLKTQSLRGSSAMIPEGKKCSSPTIIEALVSYVLICFVQLRGDSKITRLLKQKSYLWRNKFRLVTPQKPPHSAEAISICAASSRSFLLESIRTQLLRFTRVRLAEPSHL